MAHAPTVPTPHQQPQTQQTPGAGPRPDLWQQRTAAEEATSRNRRQTGLQSHDHDASVSYLGFCAAHLLTSTGWALRRAANSASTPSLGSSPSQVHGNANLSFELVIIPITAHFLSKNIVNVVEMHIKGTNQKHSLYLFSSFTQVISQVLSSSWSPSFFLWY